MTCMSGIVICYSLACMLQGYVESKITVVERLGYLVVIVLAITPYLIHSAIGILLFAVLYGYRMMEARRKRIAAA